MEKKSRPLVSFEYKHGHALMKLRRTLTEEEANAFYELALAVATRYDEIPMGGKGNLAL